MAFSLTITPGVSPIYGATDYKATVLDLNITSYTNPGGETLLPETFGLKRFYGLIVVVGQRGFVYNFTRVNNGASAKLTIAQDNGTATAAALPEIANTNNHGAVTVLALGA